MKKNPKNYSKKSSKRIKNAKFLEQIPSVGNFGASNN